MPSPIELAKTGPVGDAILRFAAGHPGLALAGGAVRDMILGRPVKDYDLAVEKGNVRTVGKAFADSVKGALVPLGAGRLVRVVVDGVTVDFTPLRAKTLEEDLRLRDFTINAMAIRLPALVTAVLVDPTGGQADLKKKVLRVCSPRSFKDDPVRVWRAIRIADEFGLKIEPGTARLLKKSSSLGARCTAERLRDELFKLMDGPRAGRVLRSADRYGMLTASLPILEKMRRVRVPRARPVDVLDHTLEALEHLDRQLVAVGKSYPAERSEIEAHLAECFVAGRSRRALLRLALLLHDIAKPVTVSRDEKGHIHFFEHEHLGAKSAIQVLRKRLRCSEDEVSVVARLIRLHLRPGHLAASASVSDKAAWRLVRDAGPEFLSLVLHADADRAATHHHRGVSAPAHRRAIRHLFRVRNAAAARKPGIRLVTGHDLMKELRLKPGPVIGDLLRAVDEAVALGRVKTRADALLLAKRTLDRSQPGVLSS